MAKKSISLVSISPLTELERIGWTWEPVSDTEVKCKCPAHADKTASCSLNIDTRVFKCHAASCAVSGDFVTFLAHALKSTRVVVIEDLATRYDITSAKIISNEVVERDHAAIWKAKPLLKALYDRGLTDEMIRKHRLGERNSRIMIPIFNEGGACVNVRRYQPGAPGADKMKNTPGHSGLRFYPIDQFEYDNIILCGGECKAIVTAAMMNPLDFGATTITGAEGSWRKDLTDKFKGKKVWVCFDIDDGGRKATDRVAARLRGTAQEVHDLLLPLDIDRYPTGDVNDYFGPEKHTGEDMQVLVEASPIWIPTTIAIQVDDTIEPEDVHLAESTKAEKTAKRVRLRAVVSMLDTTPYIVPKNVQCVCDRNQDLCTICPIFALQPDDSGADKGGVRVEICPEHPGMLDMINSSKKHQQDAIRESLGIPPCKSVEFNTREWFNVEDARLSPQLDISNRAADQVMLPSYVVGHGHEANETYEFEGRVYPHPKTQQATLLMSKSKSVSDALSTYEPSDDELNALAIFQPEEWTVDGLETKLQHIYNDMAANVTRIYKRFDLHLAIDLAYHSVLLMNVHDRIIKGWAEVLIAGDSSQGKSEAAMRMMEHYNLGTKVDCKGASVAGLLGGLQQSAGRWFVTWGVIPTHDRRLVVLEELKGASVEVISKLTDMRSSGIAEIPKIEKRKTHARTRLIALSNPRSDRALSSYSFGIEAIKELIGSLEDIRRFDFALLVSSQDIPAGVIDDLQRQKNDVPHEYTMDLCRQCILWAWTRTEEQVYFPDDTIDFILSASQRLCKEFSEIIPLIDRGSMRYKIARLATSLACRTFSCKEGDPQTVIIRKCHVEYVESLLHRVYSAPIFGYKDFSDAVNASLAITDPKEVNRRLLEAPFPRDLINQLMHTSEIEIRDLVDWTSWERLEATTLLSFLVRKHCLRRDGRSYRKTPAFIELLRGLRESDILKKVDRPDHVKEEEY